MIRALLLGLGLFAHDEDEYVPDTEQIQIALRKLTPTTDRSTQLPRPGIAARAGRETP